MKHKWIVMLAAAFVIAFLLQGAAFSQLSPISPVSPVLNVFLPMVMVENTPTATITPTATTVPTATFTPTVTPWWPTSTPTPTYVNEQ